MTAHLHLAWQRRSGLPPAIVTGFCAGFCSSSRPDPGRVWPRDALALMTTSPAKAPGWRFCGSGTRVLTDVVRIGEALALRVGVATDPAARLKDHRAAGIVGNSARAGL
jgi:hypothetical protein